MNHNIATLAVTFYPVLSCFISFEITIKEDRCCKGAVICQKPPSFYPATCHTSHRVSISFLLDVIQVSAPLGDTLGGG